MNKKYNKIKEAIETIPLNYQGVFNGYLKTKDYKALYDLFLQNNTNNQYDCIIQILAEEN